MNAADFGASLIRTWVPIIVGGVLGWLTAKGLGISSGDAEAVTASLTTAIAGVYYALIRLAEMKIPALGIFLGKPSQPTYSPPAAVPDQAGKGHARG